MSRSSRPNAGLGLLVHPMGDEMAEDLKTESALRSTRDGSPALTCRDPVKPFVPMNAFAT